MNYRFFIITIAAATVISLFNLLLVIFRIDPTQGGVLGLTLFYLSAFLCISGLFFLASIGIKGLVSKKQQLLNRVRNSWRQGFLIALLLLGWAFLKSQKLLFFWTLGLLIMIIIVLEFFFMSSQKRNHVIYEGENTTD